jgi:hypothetical protein
MDKNHLASEEYHISGAQIYFLKWGFGQEDILIQIDEGKPKLPSFVLYPYFEKDVETLIEQNFIFKFSNGYSNNG